MEPCYIKQEPKMDMCIKFESSHEFNFQTMMIKSEESPNYGFLNQPIEYKFYTDNFLNTIIKQETDIIMKADEESEDENFELKLSDTSAEGDDDARNESIPDLRAVTNKLKDAKINATPSESNARQKKAPPKVDKVVIRETPKRKNTMKQTSLLSFLKLNGSASIGTKKTPRSRIIKPATSIIDPVEMRKINSARVVLDRLPGTEKLVHHHCAKCNKDYSDLAITSNSRCVQCSEAIVFRCGQYNTTYRSQSSVRYHLDSQCLVRTEFRCSQCEFTSTVKDLLRKHEKSVHKSKVNGLIKCEKCQILFSHSHSLKRHQRLYCSKKDVLWCEACDFKTNNIIAFRGHRMTHAADRAEREPAGEKRRT